MRTVHQQGGYAFPRGPIGEDCGTPYGQTDGMTLRDWFAGQALVALPNVGCGADLSQEELGVAAYQVADAMLAARGR
jgi:hypothetical protein